MGPPRTWKGRQIVVQIELDKTRTLKFDLRATMELEQALGKPLGSILGDITNFGVTSIRTALWAGLKHEDSGLTLNLVTKLFESYVKDKKSLRVLVKALSDALDETGLFQTDDEPEGNAVAERVN